MNIVLVANVAFTGFKMILSAVAGYTAATTTTRLVSVLAISKGVPKIVTNIGASAIGMMVGSIVAREVDKDIDNAYNDLRTVYDFVEESFNKYDNRML